MGPAAVDVKAFLVKAQHLISSAQNASLLLRMVREINTLTTILSFTRKWLVSFSILISNFLIKTFKMSLLFTTTNLLSPTFNCFLSFVPKIKS